MVQRSFYEDDAAITPLPGTTKPANATEISMLGPNKLVDGISVRSPDALESHIGGVRQALSNTIHRIVSCVDSYSSKYYAEEKRITTTIANLHSNRDEELLPGTTYILLAAMTGSIMTKKSNIVLRASVPFLFGLAAFKYALPTTFANFANLVHDLEKKNLPANFTETQDKVVASASETAEFVANTSSRWSERYQSFTKRAQDLVASTTGLNVEEEVSKKK